ncbi:MAG TPA: sulfatase-like hydrolase/transferase [bacterium]|nr:sulfatase-like hydrolase/transferase [bacterium]
MTTRRDMLKWMGIGGISFPHCIYSNNKDNAMIQPNILLVHVDQLRFDCLGISGNPDIHTPNIDGLAAHGVRYTNSFCPYPICTPSRYSLLSGLYVHEHRGHDNHCTLAPDIDTFPKRLRDAGYHTKAVGKMHFTPTYLDVGFQKMELSEQDGLGRWDDDYHRDLMGLNLVDKNDLEDQRKEYRADAPEEYWKKLGALVSNLPEEHHSTTWIGDRAVNSLEKWTDTTPNLLLVGFIKPHHPFDPPAPWHEMYNPKAIALLPGYLERCPDMEYQYHKGYFDNRLWDETALRYATAYYYATISQIDHHVGRMIATLKKKGLYDNTMIIFTSDHGEYMGFHHLMLKGNYLYDPLVRVPLIIKYPHSLDAGLSSDALVNNVDVALTILKAAGVQPASSMKGHDLREKKDAREFIFCGRTEVMVRSRTRKLILTQRENAKQAFFDLTKDPLELENRYNNPEYQEEILHLRKVISEWRPDEYLTTNTFLDEDAAQIDQPNVPSRDRSHRGKIIEYYQAKMKAL